MSIINIIIFFTFLLLIGLLLAGLSFSFSNKKSDLEKLSAYECGFNAFNDARSGYYISFYLIALLYILFDIEITLLFPFALSISSQTSFSYIVMYSFLFLLILGFVYEWLVGALEWR